MQVLRFYEFCLKISIHTACSFGDKGYDRLNGEQPQRDPQKTLIAHAETRDTTHRETVKTGQPVLHSSPFYTTPKSYALQCCSIGQTSKSTPSMVAWTHQTQHPKLYISIGSAGFAQFTAQNPYTLQ